MFGPESVAKVRVPVQLWSAPYDESVREAELAELSGQLPFPADYHSVPGAGHFVFLPPCTLLPELCTDPPGFDRAAFHETFNKSIVEFFKARLAPR